MKPLRIIAIIILLAGISVHGHTFEIEIEGNTISAVTDKVPLQDVLKKIAYNHDIILRMDPDINPPVTVSFKGLELEDGLRSILKPNNHVLFWKSNPKARTPSAPPYLLDQIHVFRPGEKERMIDIAPNPAPSPETQVPLPSREPEDLEPERTRVTIKGNKVFVPVTLGYEDREIQTTLLFDTGASSIVLHRDVAEELEIETDEVSLGRGVGGVEIKTRKTQLRYVMVGPNKKDNLRADIIEYDGPEDEEYNGLLGMNFLRGLKYTIDFDNQTIQWTP